MSVIEIKNLKKYFKETKAVDDISLKVEKEEIFGFLGPNGAGKTTTIRTMMDFIRPTSGSVTMLGLDAQKDTVELKKKVGYLSGELRLYKNWTGKEHIDFVRSLNDGNDISDDIIKRFDFDPSRKVKTLSSGNRQKLGIIMAFMTKPELLIMDEPTNALDPLLQNETYDLIQEVAKQGTTVFMSSHNLAEVDRVCSQVAIIKQGKIVTTESIKNLKDKRLYTVTAHFADSFDENQFNIDGINITKQMQAGLIMNVKGDVNQVVQLLSQHKLKDLQIEHASLEDIFLEFYE